MRCNVEGNSIPAQFVCPMWSAKDARLVALQREGAHMHRSCQSPCQSTGEKAKTQLLTANPGASFWYLLPKLDVVTSPEKWRWAGGVHLRIPGYVGFAWQSADRPVPPQYDLDFRGPKTLSHRPTNRSGCYSTRMCNTSFIQSKKGLQGSDHILLKLEGEGLISANSWCQPCWSWKLWVPSLVVTQKKVFLSFG